MNFDEWLEECIREMEQFKVPHTLRLLKLVRAQRKYRFYKNDSELNEAVKEIDALEESLIGK